MNCRFYVEDEGDVTRVRMMNVSDDGKELEPINSPAYLLVEEQDEDNFTVDFQVPEDDDDSIVGFETKREAVAGAIQSMLEREYVDED